MQRSNKQIGEILIEKGLLTPQQLDDVLREQKLTKEFIGAILLRRRFVSEADFLGALSTQFGYPYITLQKENVDLAVAMQFSATYVLDHKCVPIGQSEYAVTVAIVNPLDAWSISGLEKEAKMRRVECADFAGRHAFTYSGLS